MKHNPILIRIHRIVLQIALLMAIYYYYGWMALLLVVLAFACEIPFQKFDRLNPFYRRYDDEIKQAELKQMIDTWIGGGSRPYVSERLRVGESRFFADSCPSCRREYDHADYIHQMCHHCGHDNSSTS